MSNINTSGNGFTTAPPERDASGATAEEFMTTFEFELCAECGQDADRHKVVIGPTGHWFAFCEGQEEQK